MAPINCSISGGDANGASYGGNLNLVDADTGEKFYLGGVFSASGSDQIAVTRKTNVRRVYPLINAWCSSGPPYGHGSETIEAMGNIVSVPARGGGDGDGSGGGGGGGGGGPGGDHGSQGGDEFPGAGFGPPTDPLAPGGCALRRQGTPQSDTLNGNAAPDLIFGFGGDDLIRGREGHDCLIGDAGDDLLFGHAGRDRLTGGTGNDKLVGGDGVNRYDAGPGIDILKAANGQPELVSCGAGPDYARVDRRDRVAGCEQVRRSG